MGGCSTRALTKQTWDAFEALCLRNNGAGMGDCWCCWFHNATADEKRAAGGGDWRAYKKRRVTEGIAHAALVFDGETAVGWCEYGPPQELPGIFHRKEIEFEGAPVPDYRITCLFVDRRHRRDGVATAALDGALKLIAESGGGLVETYPQDSDGKKVAASFLYNATRDVFQRAGFSYVRPKGKRHCVMRATVEPT